MRQIFPLLAVVFFAMTSISAADAENSDWFKTLMKATELADGQIGEAPHPSMYWLAYREALVEPEKVSEDTLQALHKSATPEGRLYAACLMHYSRKARKNAGDPDADLKSLAQDTSKVLYRSGCRCTNSTVGEVSSSLLKDRKFLNFKLDDLSSVKDGIPDALLKLSSARRLESSHGGEGRQSALYAYYKQARSLPLNADGWELNWLSTRGTPAGKLYGCFLALKFDESAGIAMFRKLINDDTKVQYQSGCEVETLTVGAVARQVVEKRKFADFDF